MSHTHDDERTRRFEQALYQRDQYRWAPSPAPQQPQREPGPAHTEEKPQ